jgi:hypothetical protein
MVTMCTICFNILELCIFSTEHRPTGTKVLNIIYFNFMLESCKYLNLFLYFIQTPVSLCEVVPGPDNRAIKTCKAHVIVEIIQR